MSKKNKHQHPYPVAVVTWRDASYNSDKYLDGNKIEGRHPLILISTGFLIDYDYERLVMYSDCSPECDSHRHEVVIPSECVISAVTLEY